MAAAQRGAGSARVPSGRGGEAEAGAVEGEAGGFVPGDEAVGGFGQGEEGSGRAALAAEASCQAMRL
ncbi:hypothetical protein DXA68_24325 [Bacteroides stercorirosoris]|uniref:Uncharacterized protein n=1 Tax=Bacteroides stercorirosoris TaxID=871324 RepID=A0A413GGR5_9BACE|nr:hypothetical protein DXA68_24325 [Bacteroides stercorirosoris]